MAGLLLVIPRHAAGVNPESRDEMPCRDSGFALRAPRNDGLRDHAHHSHATFGWKFGWITAPSLVSAVALTSSSSQLTASALVDLSIKVSMNENRLRA